MCLSTFYVLLDSQILLFDLRRYSTPNWVVFVWLIIIFIYVLLWCPEDTMESPWCLIRCRFPPLISGPPYLSFSFHLPFLVPSVSVSVLRGKCLCYVVSLHWRDPLLGSFLVSGCQSYGIFLGLLLCLGRFASKVHF